MCIEFWVSLYILVAEVSGRLSHSCRSGQVVFVVSVTRSSSPPDVCVAYPRGACLLVTLARSTLPVNLFL